MLTKQSEQDTVRTEKQASLREIFQALLIMSYKRGKSLKDILFRT